MGKGLFTHGIHDPVSGSCCIQGLEKGAYEVCIRGLVAGALLHISMCSEPLGNAIGMVVQNAEYPR